MITNIMIKHPKYLNTTPKRKGSSGAISGMLMQLDFGMITLNIPRVNDMFVTVQVEYHELVWLDFYVFWMYGDYMYSVILCSNNINDNLGVVLTFFCQFMEIILS